MKIATTVHETAQWTEVGEYAYTIVNWSYFNYVYSETAEVKISIVGDSNKFVTVRNTNKKNRKKKMTWTVVLKILDTDLSTLKGIEGKLMIVEERHGSGIPNTNTAIVHVKNI